MALHESIMGTIGETPLVRLDCLSTEDVDVVAKLEGFDPSGSIKGRVARRMIDEAEERGELTEGATVIEPTSGNTGIALAMVAGYRGYDTVLVMPANMSMERIKVMKVFGADVILTPACDGEDGAIRRARELAGQHDDYWIPDQFRNRANVAAHYEGTGPELWDQTDGDITHFVAAWGTSGTLVGVGRYLKEQDPSITVVGIEPESCAIQGLKNFEKGITPEIFDDELVDRVIEVEAEKAWEWTERLVREEALFLGQSSGANAVAVRRLAEEMDGGMIATAFADFGFKYLSAEPYCSDELCERVEQIRDREGEGRV